MEIILREDKDQIVACFVVHLEANVHIFDEPVPEI